jgi:hypothetical protein
MCSKAGVGVFGTVLLSLITLRIIQVRKRKEKKKNKKKE